MLLSIWKKKINKILIFIKYHLQGIHKIILINKELYSDSMMLLMKLIKKKNMMFNLCNYNKI